VPVGTVLYKVRGLKEARTAAVSSFLDGTIADKDAADLRGRTGVRSCGCGEEESALQ
jgi:hypothetical protein